MVTEVDCVVIGAGIVGLAVARALQLGGRDVVLLEKEFAYGTETSSRNSEVIHAGIYYDVGSVKARTCVLGKQMLYDYCVRRSIPHRQLGKIIVALTNNEIATLEHYKKCAEANGVDDLTWLDTNQVNQLEPAIKCVCALYSPSTGIIDTHAYMGALLADFEAAGGTLVTRTLVERGFVEENFLLLEVLDVERSIVKTRSVINSAGLYAPSFAARFEGIDVDSVPTARYAVGHYYAFKGKSPFNRLIYPIAAEGGLGIHVTLDMSGSARFGPDVRWRDGVDYTFDDCRREEFVRAIRAYFPGMHEDLLVPGYTGIRPKISGPEEPTKDFVIQTAAAHNIRGLVNLFGIESPGLTASLALADLVAQSVDENE